MNLADGTKIAEQWAILHYYLTHPNGHSSGVVTAESAVQLIEELSRAEQRERVMREALECWPLKRLISYARDNGETMMALLFEEVRDAALATPAPEQPSAEKGGQE